MNIYIYKNDQQFGPFDDAQISEALNSGEFSFEDLAWKEGLTEWVRLEDLLKKPQKMTALAEARPTAQSNFIPQSISGIENTPTIVVKKNEPLSIWALVLGIVSLLTCLVGGFLIGIPAVICGHIGISRINRHTLLGGRGMAIAGLITGYLSILTIPIFVLTIPLWVYGIMDFVILPKLKAASGTAAASHGIHSNPKTVSALGEHSAEFGELVVTLSGTGRYLCTNFKVASADSKIGEIMKQNDASLRDAATAIISGQSSASLDNPNGREAFRKQLIAEFNRLLGGEVINQIYFSKFSIQ